MGLIGSCINSSYEDLSRAVSVVKQAVEMGVTPKAAGINPVRNKYAILLSAMGLLMYLKN